MPKSNNGRKKCSNPNCIHKGELQPVENFHKDRTQADGLSYWCKDCCREKCITFKKKNPDYFKKHHQENREKDLHRNKERYEKIKNTEEYQKWGKEYRSKNAKRIQETTKKWNESPAKYDTHIERLGIYKECRRNKENPKLLEIKCYNHACKKWFIPKNKDVKKFLQSAEGIIHGTNELYCSDECKESCPVFNYRGGKFDNKPSCERRNNLQDQLSDIVLELDNYTCQMCGKSREDFPDIKLFCHHIKPMATDLMFASDVDNCITLCEECHEKVHKLPGCHFHELREKAREQREAVKNIIKNLDKE